MMRLRARRPVVKGSLRGFAAVELKHFTLFDVPVHVSHGKPWAAVPGKPVVDADGRHKILEGRRVYAPVLAWNSREVSERFSRAVLALVAQHYPECLAPDGEGEP